jgi:hypothetical protein
MKGQTMKRIITLLTLLLAANWSALRASAEDGEVATLFLQNNGELTGHIWVNGRYQGYVSPGKARYTVREGFVTRDSGVQPDGSVKQTWAQGGWDSKSPIKVRIVEVDNTNWFDTTIEVTGDDLKKGYVWFGETDNGAEPGSVVWEQATQISPGTPPAAHTADYVVKAETKKTMSLAGTVWKITYGDTATNFIKFNANGDWCVKSEDSEEWGCSREGVKQTWKQNGDTITWEYDAKTWFLNEAIRSGDDRASGELESRCQGVIYGRTLSGTDAETIRPRPYHGELESYKLSFKGEQISR